MFLLETKKEEYSSIYVQKYYWAIMYIYSYVYFVLYSVIIFKYELDSMFFKYYFENANKNVFAFTSFFE